MLKYTYFIMHSNIIMIYFVHAVFCLMQCKVLMFAQLITGFPGRPTSPPPRREKTQALPEENIQECPEEGLLHMGEV